MRHTIKATSRKHLFDIISVEIDTRGTNVNLNHIDVSEITDMSGLFGTRDFNGDISRWNVSKVINMYRMFEHSKFRGDLTNWKLLSHGVYSNAINYFLDSPLGYTGVLQGLCPLPVDWPHAKDFQQLQALAESLELNRVETAKMMYHHITGTKPLIPETNFSNFTMLEHIK